MHEPRNAFYVRTGVVYSLALTVCGFLLLQGGHGTPLPLLVFASPVSALTQVLGLVGQLVALVSPLPLWTGLTILLVRARTRGRGWQVGLPALGAHYLGVFVVMQFLPPPEMWERVFRVWGKRPDALILAGGLYVIGQLGLWALALVPYQRHFPEIEEVWRD